MVSMMFCSVSRRCWRDILGGNSSFLDSHVVYFCFLLLSYALSLVWACGDIWSLMCPNGLFWVDHFPAAFPMDIARSWPCTCSSFLIPSACPPIRLVFFVPQRVCISICPVRVNQSWDWQISELLGHPVDCNHTFLYMVWCPFERRKPPFHICLSLGLLLEPLSFRVLFTSFILTFLLLIQRY